jgi:repressor LexA
MSSEQCPNAARREAGTPRVRRDDDQTGGDIGTAVLTPVNGRIAAKSNADESHGATLMNLTPRQLDVIVAVRNYRHLHGMAPTMQELADQLGTSKVTIFEHVGALERKGVIRRDKHKARSLEIVGAGRLPDEDRGSKLPLLGTIAAGSPIEAIENREEIDLETLFHARKGVYVLRVRGESMIDDHLCDGDYVVIERRETARNGEQVVALLDTGEATLKRFYREGNKIRLQPANRTMEPRIVDADRCRVQGVVIGVLRSYGN